jgi:pyrroloquinoline quinone biosynthesis protein B
MQVKILGSAAGGGFPQWNCNCGNCRGLREGRLRGRARTQTQLAVSSDGVGWFLLNASPDLRAQIEATPALHPRAGVGRGSPILGVVLPGGDLDQVLGLLLLREMQPLRVYATASVHRLLREDNTMYAALAQTSDQSRWSNIMPGVPFELATACDVSSGIHAQAFSLGEHWPLYVSPGRRAALAAGESVVGLVVDSPAGGRVVFMPSAPEVDDACLALISSSDVLLFDGTFWTNDELSRLTGRTARQMGHMPVSGDGGSLERLAGTPPRKIYIHVNNTNPMLDEDSPQHRAVRDAGWEIAEDQWHFVL